MSSCARTQYQKFNHEQKISPCARERPIPPDKNLSTTLAKFSTEFGYAGDASMHSPDVAIGSRSPEQCSQRSASEAILVCRSLFGASGPATGPGIPTGPNSPPHFT